MNDAISRTANPITVVGLPGSRRAGSYTRTAVEIALEATVEVGANTLLLDLRDYDLPFSSGDPRERNYAEDVYKLREDIQNADGVIPGSPEYHGGMRGVLNNAIDMMDLQEFEGKLIGLIGVSGGQMVASNALVSLRNVGRALHAWVIPKQVSIPQAWRKFDRHGALADDGLRKRLKSIGRQVARYSSLHASGREEPFQRKWEASPENPGGIRQGETT
ncbi:MAG: NAD(P)H-dependent oxidoreductase [Anaerolineae bacterium]|nr:MAG: NAD(P)H-dependent oxidoreductase [Anaerolineae bacterium]